VPDIPDYIVLKRHRDFDGRGWYRWLERAVLAVFLAFVVLALLNVFGQATSTVHADSTAATMKLTAPERLRGGLLFGARLDVHARRDIQNAILVLDGGWLNGFTMNTLAPSPLGEASRDGKLVLTIGHIPAGHTYTQWMQFQVNATNVGTDSQDIVLLDGQQRLAELHRSVTTFP
jgi:hypothetical protein